MTGDSLVGRLRQKATELRALDANASAGPWAVDGHSHASNGCRCMGCQTTGLWQTTNGIFCDEVPEDAWTDGEPKERCKEYGYGYTWSDAALIAAARPLPALVAEHIENVLSLHFEVRDRHGNPAGIGCQEGGEWPCPDVLALTPFLGEPE